MKISRYMRLCGSSIVLAALMLLQGTPVWAAIIEAPIFQTTSTVEDGGTVSLGFVVTNNNPFDVILDYALLTVFPGPPDLSDYANFPTVTNWSPTIVAGGTVPFNYNFQVAPPDTNEPVDFGTNNVTFATEWSPLLGNPLVTIVGQQGGLVILDNANSLIPTADFQQGVAGLFNGVIPLNPIYVGGQQDIVTAKIYVYDVPEPATLALIGIGLATLTLSQRRKS